MSFNSHHHNVLIRDGLPVATFSGQPAEFVGFETKPAAYIDVNNRLRPVYIKPTEIVVTRAEGPAELTNKPFRASNWHEANWALLTWSKTAPDRDCYDKCDFRIKWADGKSYNGRYDLHKGPMPSIQDHIRQIARFYTGQYCPPHMTEKAYREFISQNKEFQEAYQQLLDSYDIGQKPEFIADSDAHKYVVTANYAARTVFYSLERYIIAINEEPAPRSLLYAMASRSKENYLYLQAFNKWLIEGGTVLLRDELCAPFQSADFIPKTDPCGFHNTWTAIDSAGLHARSQDAHYAEITAKCQPLKNAAYPDRSYDPYELQIIRHVFSTTQGEVTLIYKGQNIGRFGDEYKIDSSGKWAGFPDYYWHNVARRTFSLPTL
jgi:hypothetical protein